jgi:hypothetical protein
LTCLPLRSHPSSNPPACLLLPQPPQIDMPSLRSHPSSKPPACLLRRQRIDAPPAPRRLLCAHASPTRSCPTTSGRGRW